MALLSVCTSLADEAASAIKENTQSPLQLPTVTVEGSKLVTFVPFRKEELDLPGFGVNDFFPELFYPGKAYVDGVTTGKAVVGVELDAQGHPLDYLTVAYTKDYFGDALMRRMHAMTFKELRVKGVAVPSRFLFQYNFSPQFTVYLNSVQDAVNRMNHFGEPPLIYSPQTEDKLDLPLQLIQSAVPNLPPGYQASDLKKLRVMVTFYVDEKGHVRLPSVDAADSPALIPNAILAVKYWTFVPPTYHGKPTLVFAGRSVGFFDPSGASSQAAPSAQGSK